MTGTGSAMVNTPAMAHKDPTIFPQTPTGLRMGNELVEEFVPRKLYRSRQPIRLPISILILILTLVVSSFMDPKSSLKFHVTFLQSRMVKSKILSNSSKGKLKACYSQRKIPAGLNNNKNISMWDFSEKYFWLKIKIEIFNWNLLEEKEIQGLYKFESYVQTYRKLQ